jgi:hypothetical protein
LAGKIEKEAPQGRHQVKKKDQVFKGMNTGEYCTKMYKGGNDIRSDMGGAGASALYTQD